MIIDCIADLHGHYPELEGGDLLIVAGDLTARDTEEEYSDLFSWLRNQEYEQRVLIAGNHDNYLMECKWVDKLQDIGEFIYLCDSGTEFQYEVLGGTHTLSCMGVQIYETKKLKIWGSPWTKTFEGMNPKCKAFTVDTDEELAEKWALIPEDTDILITHGPPYGTLDAITGAFGTDLHVGSKSLDDQVFYMQNLQLHVFGHIHESGGQVNPRTRGASDKYISVNCSLVNEHYQPVNKPVRISIS